jgi:hypothetical protein
MKGLQDIYNQYDSRVKAGEVFSPKDKDTYRFVAELITSMLYEITFALKNVFPEDHEGILDEARKKGCIIQLEKLEGLRHATLHFPDDLNTFRQRQDDFLTYVQGHGKAIGFLESVIDRFSEGYINQYPDVSERFNSKYFSGIHEIPAFKENPHENSYE